jgi:hypothetical protein
MTVVIIGALPAGAVFLLGLGLALMLWMLLWEIHRARTSGITITAIVLACCGVRLIPMRAGRSAGRDMPISSRAPPTFLVQPEDVRAHSGRAGILR